MPDLDQQTFNDIVNLLIPHCADPASRKGLAERALYGCSVLDGLDYAGNPRDYVAHFVTTLLTYGDCQKGQPSIVAVLEQVKTQVGITQQETIDKLIVGVPGGVVEKPADGWQIQVPISGQHIFISYSRENLADVRRITTDLLNAGVNVWIDQTGLKAGTADWEQALRDAIDGAYAVLFMASPAARRSAYVRDELAIAQAKNKVIYPVWVDGEERTDVIPMGLGYVQLVDVRGDAYTAGLQQLVDGLSTDEDPEPSPPQVEADTSKPIRNPYKGLRAFRAEDAEDFYGRDTLIEELINKLGTVPKPPRLLAVLGASGSGKSSVIMAGLLPRLQGGAIEGSDEWLYLDPIVPGTHPIESLTIALAKLLNRAHTDIGKDLRDLSKRGLHTLSRELSGKPVVLYIDQFEELFTLVNDEAERRQFIDLLTTAITEPNGTLIVILSMRADFYDRPAQYQEFGALIEANHVLVKPMSLADLYDVVQKPASENGLVFDEGLATEIVFDVREEAGALPLLQFTLDQLYEQRDGHTLTKAAYEDMGGVEGALAQHAEATYQKLASEKHKQLARSLFLRLIEPGVTEQDTTRRRATMSELTLRDSEKTDILHKTISTFVDKRLLVSDKSRSETTVEVSHEALIREWQRLGNWLQEARDDLRLQKSLAADVVEWKRRDESADMLYRGTVLEEAQIWASRNTPSKDEEDFLARSQSAQDKRMLEAKEQQENLIALQAQALARFRLAIGLAIPYVAILSVGLIIFIILASIRTSYVVEASVMLEVGDIAPRDIIAPTNITYVSNVLTGRIRQEAQDAVLPIYNLPDPNIARQQTNLALQLLEYIQNVRADVYGTTEQQIEDLSAITSLSLSNETMSSILQFDDATWTDIENEVVTVISRIMRSEIRPGQEVTIISRINNHVSVRFNTTERDTIADIVDDLIVPNTFQDVEATSNALDNAAASVEPQSITFTAGQIIVREGEMITELQSEAIAELELRVFNRTNLNWRLAISKMAVGIGLIILFAVFIAQRIVPNRIHNKYFIYIIVTSIVIWGIAMYVVSYLSL